MVKYIQEGAAIDYTPDDDVVAGAVVILGGLVGITKLPITGGETGALALTGVYEFPKAAEAFSIGDNAYWDVADEEINSSSSGNTLIGPVVADADADAATVRVRLEQ